MSKKKNQLTYAQKIMVSILAGILSIHVVEALRTTQTITGQDPTSGVFISYSTKVWVWAGPDF